MTGNVRKFITWVAGLLLLAGVVLAAGAEDEIRQAEKEWAAAVMALDFSALEKTYSDDLIYAHSTGTIESKTEYLTKLRSGTQKYDLIEHKKTTIRTFPGAAVAHSIVRMKGTSKGTPFDNELMMIHFWIKQGGSWRLVAHQTTRLTR